MARKPIKGAQGGKKSSGAVKMTQMPCQQKGGGQPKR